MSRYQITGMTVGTKHLGVIEANSKQEAEERAWLLDEVFNTLVLGVPGDTGQPEIVSVQVEEIVDSVTVSNQLV